MFHSSLCEAADASGAVKERERERNEGVVVVETGKLLQERRGHLETGSRVVVCCSQLLLHSLSSNLMM